MAGSTDVDKALKLLMGDFIRKKPYIMMTSNPDKGDAIIQRFRTITDARRYANIKGIEEYTLWSELKLKRKTIRKKAAPTEEETEDLIEDELDEELDDEELDDEDEELDDEELDDELV